MADVTVKLDLDTASGLKEIVKEVNEASAKGSNLSPGKGGTMESRAKARREFAVTETVLRALK